MYHWNRLNVENDAGRVKTYEKKKKEINRAGEYNRKHIILAVRTVLLNMLGKIPLCTYWKYVGAMIGLHYKTVLQADRSRVRNSTYVFVIINFSHCFTELFTKRNTLVYDTTFYSTLYTWKNPSYFWAISCCHLEKKENIYIYLIM